MREERSAPHPCGRFVEVKAMTDLSPLLRIRDAHVRCAGREILAVDEFSPLPRENRWRCWDPTARGSRPSSASLPARYTRCTAMRRLCFWGDARVTLADIKRALGGVVHDAGSDSLHVPAQDIVAGGLFGLLGYPQRCTVTDGQRARARAIMNELGIGDLAERDILTLSTGQARRVLIARALVHDPTSSSSTNPARDSTPKECTMFGKR